MVTVVMVGMVTVVMVGIVTVVEEDVSGQCIVGGGVVGVVVVVVWLCGSGGCGYVAGVVVSMADVMEDEVVVLVVLADCGRE